MKDTDKTLAEEILVKKIFPKTTKTTLDGIDYEYKVNPERHKQIINAMLEFAELYHDAKMKEEQREELIEYTKYVRGLLPDSDIDSNYVDSFLHMRHITG